MKSIKYIVLCICSAAVLASCEKKEYPMGLPEYEHHYYAAFLPNNNSNVVVQKTSTALLKFPVQFYSSFVRSYSPVAHYSMVIAPTNTTPAVLGVDYQVVDRNGQTIQPVDGKYSLTFPEAKKVVDTIYIKMLNNPAPGTRRTEVQIIENTTDEYYVDIFSTAFRRPIEIR